MFGKLLENGYIYLDYYTIRIEAISLNIYELLERIHDIQAIVIRYKDVQLRLHPPINLNQMEETTLYLERESRISSLLRFAFFC